MRKCRQPKSPPVRILFGHKEVQSDIAIAYDRFECIDDYIQTSTDSCSYFEEYPVTHKIENAKLDRLESGLETFCLRQFSLFCA